MLLLVGGIRCAILLQPLLARASQRMDAALFAMDIRKQQAQSYTRSIKHVTACHRGLEVLLPCYIMSHRTTTTMTGDAMRTTSVCGSVVAVARRACTVDQRAARCAQKCVCVLARAVYGELCLKGGEGYYRWYEPELPNKTDNGESSWEEEGGSHDNVVVDNEPLAVQVKKWQSGEAIA